MKYLILIILISTSLFADVNKKYSYKDFMDKSLKGADVAELNNSTIIGSCFYQQENPDADIFPDGMTGVIFQRCNLDNVLVTAENTVDESNTHKKLKTQKDKCTWILDADNKPLEPLNKSKFIELDLSIDPLDIPTEEVEENILQKKEKELKEQEEIDVAQFKEDRKNALKLKDENVIDSNVKKVKE